MLNVIPSPVNPRLTTVLFSGRLPDDSTAPSIQKPLRRAAHVVITPLLGPLASCTLARPQRVKISDHPSNQTSLSPAVTPTARPGWPLHPMLTLPGQSLASSSSHPAPAVGVVIPISKQTLQCTQK